MWNVKEIVQNWSEQNVLIWHTQNPWFERKKSKLCMKTLKIWVQSPWNIVEAEDFEDFAVTF